MSLKKRTKNKKGGTVREAAFSIKVTILATCISRFLFTELHFHAEIITNPTPRLQV
jgi:hypothetical protein